MTNHPKQTSRRMTEGNILVHLLLFALPLLIGNIFQQLYNTVDSIVVGNYVNKNALAAVGGTDSIINTLIGFFMGLSTGAGVVISYSFGQKDNEGVHRAVHTTITLTFLLGIAFTIVGSLLVPILLKIAAVPDDVLPESTTYLRIYFAGIMGLMFYNMGSGILRAVGDSKRPLYVLIVCALTNIALDLLFVIVLHAGVGGVALATVISQWISAIIILIILTKEKESYRLIWRDLHLDIKTVQRIFRVGFPAGLQMAITSFSNVFVQSYINHFGSSCMAGWTAYSKLDKFCLLPIQSVGLSITTFVGQNLGANQKERAKKGTTIALCMAFAAAAILMVPVMVFAPALVSLFNKDPEVLGYGVRFVHLMMPFYFSICFNQIYANSLRGAGDSTAPMIIMMFSFIVFRQIYLYITSMIFGTITAAALGYPLGWIVCSLILFFYYHFANWQKRALG